MFIRAYETRRVPFAANDCAVMVTGFPNGEFGAYLDGEEEGGYREIGDTPLAAIADLAESLAE